MRRYLINRPDLKMADIWTKSLKSLAYFYPLAGNVGGPLKEKGRPTNKFAVALCGGLGLKAVSHDKR